MHWALSSFFIVVYFEVSSNYGSNCSQNPPTTKILPVGIDDFTRLIESNSSFIDKTDFIKDILSEKHRSVVVTRPPRFGKSINLSMLNAFLNLKLAHNSSIFNGLNIRRHTDFCNHHQNKYPVVYISCSNIEGEYYVAAMKQFNKVIATAIADHLSFSDLFVNFPYRNDRPLFLKIFEGRAEAYESAQAIRSLCKFLKWKYKKKVIILIDNYDTPVHQSYLYDYDIAMVELIKFFLEKTIDSNRYLEKAILTGYTKKSDLSVLSFIRNITIYTIFDDKYTQYFGFSESDVQKLMSASKTKLSIKDLKPWYWGYSVGKQVLYNPYSIVHALSSGTLAVYWASLETFTTRLIRKLLKDLEIPVQPYILDLLQRKEIDVKINDGFFYGGIAIDDDMFWTYLVQMGYLKTQDNFKPGDEPTKVKLHVQNEEVGSTFTNLVKSWFVKTEIGSNFPGYSRSIVSGDVDGFKNYISDYLIKLQSRHDLPKRSSEIVFNTLILGSAIGLIDKYEMHSSKTPNFGKVNVTIIPKDRSEMGVAMQFNQSLGGRFVQFGAEDGIAQIKENQEVMGYLIQSNVKSAFMYGVSLMGKFVAIIGEKMKIGVESLKNQHEMEPI